MHYFKFNISDWVSNTTHLLPVQEGIYLRLINHYYDKEQPIPLDYSNVLRRLRLTEDDGDVETVLNDFFIKTDKGYIHKRCDKDLKEFKKKAKINKVNGAKGGRPKQTKDVSVTQEKPTGLLLGSEKKPSAKATKNYKPLTINHELLTNLKEEEKILFLEYLQLRKLLKLKTTDSIIKRLINKYIKFGSNIEVIEKAITGNWKDFYEIKTNEKNQQTNKPESNHARVMRICQEDAF